MCTHSSKNISKTSTSFQIQKRALLRVPSNEDINSWNTTCYIQELKYNWTYLHNNLVLGAVWEVGTNITEAHCSTIISIYPKSYNNQGSNVLKHEDIYIWYKGIQRLKTYQSTTIAIQVLLKKYINYAFVMIVL